MKRFLCFAFIISILSLSVFAIDDPYTSLDLVESDYDVDLDSSDLLSSDFDSFALTSLASVPVSGSSSSDPVLIGFDYAPDPVEGTLLEAMYGVFGKPIIAAHYRYTTGSTNQQISYSTIDYNLDYHWLSSVAVFMLVLYCSFKLGGGIICRK